MCSAWMLLALSLQLCFTSEVKSSHDERYQDTRDERRLGAPC